VRRHLGIYAKAFPPQVSVLVRLFIIQTVVVLLSISMPLLFDLVAATIVVSAFVLPAGWYLFAQTTLVATLDAATSMQKETENNTLSLLRSTPFSLREIMLGKIAAAMWRRVQDISLVLLIAAVFGLPPILLTFASKWSPQEYRYLYHGAVAIVFGASILRVMLELFMITAIGIMTGSMVHSRSAATITALVLVFFYFLLINLIRLLPFSLGIQVVVEAVLPLVAPVAVGLIAIRLAERAILRD
jgi:ABC-type transport system involved in multi-copper enzyme maturation permease subunit